MQNKNLSPMYWTGGVVECKENLNDQREIMAPYPVRIVTGSNLRNFKQRIFLIWLALSENGM